VAHRATGTNKENFMHKLVVAALWLLFANCAFGQTATATINGSQDVVAGNADARNAGNIQNITFNGGTSQALLPGTTGAPAIPSPGIFTALGNTPGSASVPFIAMATKLCGVRYNKKFLPESKVVDGQSGHTTLIFSPFPTLLTQVGSKVEVEEITPPELSPNIIEKSMCLGTITVITKGDAGNTTDFSIVQNDAMRHVAGLPGFRKVILVSLINAVSAASGVTSEGSSFGLGGVVGHVLSTATSLGLGPTFGKGSGNTVPTNYPGGTFLVLAFDEEGGKDFDTSLLGHFFLPSQAVNGKAPMPAKIDGK
jgi:hypothetical protein